MGESEVQQEDVKKLEATSEEHSDNQSESQEEEFLPLLIAGIDEETKTFIRQTVPDHSLKEFTNADQFLDSFEEFEEGMFLACVVGSEFGIDFVMEAAQLVKCQCPDTPLFYLTHNKSDFNSKMAKKNGFDEVGLFPLDKDMIKEKLLYISWPESLGVRAYKPVKIFDLSGEAQLDFDTFVYLPLNKKMIQFGRTGKQLGTERVEKLKSKSKSNVYIHKEDQEKFFDQAATWLKDINNSTAMTETERTEKLESAIKSIFVDIFDTSDKSSMSGGAGLIDTCKNIVSTYITGNSNVSWYQQMLSALGGQAKGFYSASEISTISALIALGTQLADPIDVAVGALFRDLSLTDFSEDLLATPKEKWDEISKKQYEKHPQLSVNIVKSKKMILTEKAEKAILQHEERYNGTGFPKGQSGDIICMEAQILIFSEAFYELTQEIEGQKSYRPNDALEKIREMRLVGPELLTKLKPLFSEAG